VKYDDAKKIIKNISELNLKWVFISGGEPLLYKDLKKLVLEIKDHGIEVWLCTNGVLLSKRDDILNIIDHVSIGLESVDPKVFRAIRGTDFNIIVDAMNICKNYGINLSVDFTLLKQNISEIDNVIDFLVEKDVDRIYIRRFVPLGRGKINRELLDIDKQQVLNVFKHVIEKYSIEGPASNKVYSIDPMFIPLLHIYGYADKKKEYEKYFRGCPVTVNRWTSIYLKYAYPCPLLARKFAKFDIANTTSDGIINYINNNPFLNRENYNSDCVSCHYYKTCGGCRAHAYAVSGNVFDIDPLCPLKNNV